MDENTSGNIDNAADFRRRYAAFLPPAMGLSTVRDFCDSWDNVRALSSIAGDLKDVQRPWILKAIVACVPPGGRICEVGAGEPFVASMLQKFGYDVTVVDPYNGSGRGPTEFDTFSAAYPDIKFIRSDFQENMPQFAEQTFDAIYSISVIEHIPLTEVEGLCRGMRRYLKRSGWSVHAMDHVLSGAGAEYHFRQLLMYAEAFGLSQARVENVLERGASDPETYFLSAEGHNRWRGSTKYEEFPMRRVVSVNFANQFF